MQLREKNITTREFVELARKSKAITDKVRHDAAASVLQTELIRSYSTISRC